MDHEIRPLSKIRHGQQPLGARWFFYSCMLCVFAHRSSRRSPVLALSARGFFFARHAVSVANLKPHTLFSVTKRNETTNKKQVKLVLAAAMWMRPHLLVLDEPTNYLDREALGALTLGIKEFGGGVIIISHNSEFLNAITTETWLLEGGRLQTIGGAQEVRERETWGVRGGFKEGRVQGGGILVVPPGRWRN